MRDGELRFDGQVAIVTGAGRGIGRAHALALAARGAAVVVNDVGRAENGGGPIDEAPAAEVAAQITAAGGAAVASTDDITEIDGAERLVRRAVDELGGLHAVVNNAGVVDFRPFAETTHADVARQLALDPLGAFNVTRAAWPHLVAQRYGRMVFTSSAAAFGGAEQSAYGTGKASLLGLGRSVAAAGAPQGITANILMPYAFSRMTFVGTTIPEDEQLLRQRVAPPELVAAVVLLLAHDACPASGEIISTAGGRVCRIALAETPGILDVELTPERLLERWDDVVAADGAVEVGDLEDYTDRFYAHLPGWRTG